jgi:hypothetical protein
MGQAPFRNKTSEVRFEFRQDKVPLIAPALA